MLIDMRSLVSAGSVAFALSLVACQAATSTSTSTTTSTTATAVTTATTAAAASPDDVLQLALTVHVERHATEVRDPVEFESHVAMLQRLSDLALAYDVVLNFELSSEFVQAIDVWGSTFIENMTAIGHNISQHSGDQSTEGLIGAARTAELIRQREAIEAHGVTVNYASGGCSADDWVESAIAAGLSAVTGNVEYCLKSLDGTSLPAGMEWIHRCTNQAICHDPLHVGTARVLHPWTTSSSATWLVDDPNGELVIIAAAEADAFVAMSQGGQADVAPSLEQWTAMIDAYVAATVVGQVNVVNMVLSVGPMPDWSLIESMFEQAQSRQEAGLLVWANLSEVVAQALAEAPLQAADAVVVYTDTTPDLGGGLP